MARIRNDHPDVEFSKREMDARVHAYGEAEKKWINDTSALTVRSANCALQVPHLNFTPMPCGACESLWRLPAFKNALSRTAFNPATAKFTPKSVLDPIRAEAAAYHQDCHELLLIPENKRWLTFARRLAQGRYDSFAPMLGMIDAAMKVEDRRFRGKQLTNMQYDSSYDDLCTNIALTSPRAYRKMQKALGGRSLRNIRHHVSKAGRFQAGIVDVNLDTAQECLRRLNYNGPLVLGVDDTKLTPALQSYQDGNEWKVAGTHGPPVPFASYSELSEMMEIDPAMLAEKQRAWLLSFPIPGIPPILIGTMSINNAVSQDEIAEWHQQLSRGLLSRGLHYVSYNVDGAAPERGHGHSIDKNATARCTWTFVHPDPKAPALTVSVPLLENGMPSVVGTDGKHSRKNARGAAMSGARVLVLGNFIVHFGQFAVIAREKKGPLRMSDVFGVDKADDRSSARFFSAPTLEYCAEKFSNEPGLAIYLFVIGELEDAQQNRTISHSERLLMLFRGRFFLDGWRDHIVSHPHYSVNTHFISRELYDILCIYTDAMVGLILAYRDYYPSVPLCPWLHSTESIEHYFGCARQIQKDFTAKEFLLMIPKITLLMAGDMKHAPGMQAAATEKRSGYHHTWFDSKGVDPVNLSNYPSNTDVQAAIDRGFFEATHLLQILGMSAPGPSAPDNTTVSIDEDGEDDGQLSLAALLLADGQDALHSRVVPTVLEREIEIISSSVVAQCLHNEQRINTLPEHDLGHEKEWMATILALSETIEAARTMHHRQVQSTTVERNRLDALADAKAQAFDFGTANNLNFGLLVKIRRAHETEEARSAISHAFRHATSADEVVAEATEGQSKERLDMHTVNRLTRLISESLVGTSSSSSMSGKERKIRWQEMGISGRVEDFDVVLPKDEVQASTARKDKYAGARALYKSIEQHVAPLLPQSGGINPLCVLRPGSWVLVCFEGELWVGQVLVIYVEGGGKNPSHNFSPSCTSVYSISRLVVQLYQSFALGVNSYYSPAVADLEGQKVPSFAFLHQGNLVASFDCFGNSALEPVEFGQGSRMYQPSPAFSIAMSALKPHRAKLSQLALQVIDAYSRRQSKRSVQADYGEEGEAGPSSKRRR